MQTSVEQLAAAGGRYEGEGDGAESGPFHATIDVRPVLDGLGVELVYEATGDSGTLHSEHTVLTYDMMTGEPTLFVLCDELRGMAHLRQLATNRFGNGVGREGFELEIELALDHGELTYVWSWGPPHEDLAERTRAVLHRST